MTTIRATCPTCGEVELTSKDLELKVCTYSPSSFYRFDCPLCHEDVRKPADDRIVQLLISGGVQASVFEMPGEGADPQAPAFTIDDLLDFRLLLQTEDWFEQLLRTTT
jgi:hypothetical protein